MFFKKANTLISVIFIIVAIFITVCQPTFADEANQSTAEYRVQPLHEKLTVLTDDDVTNSLERFSDLSKHWSREYVGKLNLLEIVAGYGDGRFGPEDTLKVDEFLKMVLKVMGHKIEEGMGYWAEPYIKLAKDEEIIEDNEFTDYRRSILREEAAMIIIKAALKVEEAPIPNHISYARLRIPDYHDVGDEYKQHVLYSYSMGFITGVGDRRFLPKKTLTRGEGSAIIMRYLDKDMRKPMRPKDNEIVSIYDKWANKTFDIYPPSEPEVIDVIRVMKNIIDKSKGFVDFGYNPTDEVVIMNFYNNDEDYEKGSIFIDGGIDIRMAEWELEDYDIIVFEPEATKELHRDVFIELFNHLFGKEAEKAIKDFDEYLELGSKGGEERIKRYTLNNRKVLFTKYQGNKRFGISIGLQNQ